MATPKNGRRAGNAAGRKNDHASSLLINPAYSQGPCVQQVTLSAEEELRLARAWRDHDDDEARNKLVESHVPLAQRISHQYARSRDLTSDRAAELYSEAYWGLMRAADRYDPERGARFATAAHLSIREAIESHLRRERSMVRGCKRRDWSLDVPLSDETEETEADALPDNAPDPETALILAQDAEHYGRVRRAALSVARNDRERKIVESMWLSDERPKLREIGREIGVSRERVRQIAVCLYDRVSGELRRRFGAGIYASEHARARAWREDRIPWGAIDRARFHARFAAEWSARSADPTKPTRWIDARNARWPARAAA